MRSATFDRAAAPTDAHADLDAARRLAEALRDGGWLTPVAVEEAPLEPGESAFADMHASGWRYFALDQVGYDRRTLLLGGPFLMALTGIASFIGNGRRRRDAERAAPPQWRPLGSLRIVVTSRRLLVWFDHAWWSVWYSAITDIRTDSANSCLDLFFDEDAPYRLVGTHVRALTVMVDYACAGETLAFPGAAGSTPTR